jgi:hypothetical protein
MNLEQILVLLQLLGKVISRFKAMVSLQLDYLSQLFIIDDGAVASEALRIDR